ncbi:MAG: hypothetical protein RJA15_1515, partial [Actinomycetota bacterium]
MKFNRGVALGTSLVLILAACGDSSSSSRDRNATFAGTECYTQDEFPALKVQATAMSNTYVATAKEVEVAKELATTNLLAWKNAENVLTELNEIVAAVQATFDAESEKAAESLSRYINAVSIYLKNPNVDKSAKQIMASAIADLNFEKDYWQTKAAGSDAELKRLADELRPAIERSTQEVKEKLQTSELSVEAYNALIEKYDGQVAEYKKFTSIKPCPVGLSAGDAEGPAPSSTTSTTKPTFQFEETPASPIVTIEGGVTDSTISSTDETTATSSSTIANSSSS